MLSPTPKFAFWVEFRENQEQNLSRELFRELAIMQAPEAAPGSFSSLVFSFDVQC